MRVLGFELERAFRNKWFYISLVIGTLVGVLDIVLFQSNIQAFGKASLIQVWLGTDYRYAYNAMYFYVLFPILACMPYAGSYYEDMHTKYDKNIQVKTSRNKYFAAKAVAVFLSAFAAVSLPLLINLYIVAGIYPDSRPEKLTFLAAGIIDCNMYAEIFHEHPAVYCIVYTMLDGVLGGVMGLMALSLSKWIKSRFDSIVMPFILYLFSNFFGMIGLDGGWALCDVVNPVQYSLITWGRVTAMILILIAISLVVTWLYSRRRDVL